MSCVVNDGVVFAVYLSGILLIIYRKSARIGISSRISWIVSASNAVRRYIVFVWLSGSSDA